MKWNRLLVIPLMIAMVGVWLLWPKSSKAAPWYNDSWKFRKKLVIDNTKVTGPSDLTDFPVLVSRSDTDLQSRAQPNGNDILFTDINGTKLSHEIESYSNGNLVAWVKVPTLATATDTTLYMYYGNPSASSQQSVNGVWDSNYKGVWHINESTGTRNDSSSNGNNLTASGTTGTEGKIAGANNFVSASNQNLSISNASDVGLDITGKLTIEGWIYTTSAGATQIISSKDGSSGNQGYIFRYSSSNRLTFLLSNDGTAQTTLNGSTTTLTAGVWYHVAAVYDGTNMSVYLNGTSDGVTAYSSGIFNSTSDFKIGIRATSSNPFDGNIDEVRVSNTNRSQYWIQTSFNNQNSPSTFFTTTGSEESAKSPVAYWSFDEGSGTTAYDGLGGNNGTLTNGPVWRPESDCVSGKCIYFDGSNDYIDAGDPTPLDVTSSFTISAWIKMPSSTNNQTIYSKTEGTTNGSFWFFKRRSGLDNKLAIQTFPTGGNGILGEVVPENTWQHIAVVYNSGTATLYQDGRQTGTGSVDTITANALNANIGRRSDAGSYMYGFLDEVKVYQYARTAAEIKADMASRGAPAGVDTRFGDGDIGRILSNGLIGYWKMDEAAANSCTGGSNDACDSSGNGSDMAWNTSAPTIVAAKFGNGLDFETSNSQYMGIADNSILSVGSSFTLSAWIKPESIVNGGIISKDGGGSNRSYYLSIQSNVLRFLVSSDGTNVIYRDSGTTLTAGNWYHILGVFNSASRSLDIYVNGQLDNGTLTGTVPSSIYNGTAETRIGNAPSNGYFDGIIDEARIYNRALSVNEISTIYNWAAGPLGYWKFDESSGTSAADSSGNQYTGTLTAMEGDEWRPGKFGNALELGTSGEYVSAGDIPDPTSQITISAWINWKAIRAYDGIASKRNSTENDGNWVLRADDAGSGKLQWIIWQTSTQQPVLSTSVLPTNTWVHVALTFDEDTNTTKMYINGVLDKIDTSTITNNLADTADPFIIGYDNQGSSYFDGLIDDVKVYNYVRSSGQIVEDMNAAHPLGGSPIGSQTAYYKFDEGYGSTANNSISSSYAGSLAGATTPTWANAGKFGKALYFAGSTTNNPPRVTASPINLGTTTGDQQTISMWVKPDSTQVNANAYLIRNGTGTDQNTGINLTSLIGGNFQIQFAYYNGTSFTGYATTNRIVPVSTWSHIALVITQGTNVKFYLNGKLIETKTWSGANSVSATTSFNIGGHTGTTGQSYTGYIDEVKVYQGGLTDNQILIDYNQGSAAVLGTTSTASDGITADSSAAREYCIPGDTTACAGPVGEWKLDENTSTSVYDTSSNATAGSLGAGGSAPSWVAGRFGSALVFDGTDDYVDINDSTVLRPGNGSWSVFVWAKPDNINQTGALIGKSQGSGNFEEFEMMITGVIGAGSTGKKLQVSYRESSSIERRKISTNDVVDGNWHQYGFVANQAADTLTLYVDGIPQSTTGDISSGAWPTIDNTPNLWIGDVQATNDRNFTGSIDTVRIYNYARTPAQIAWDYNRGAPVAWYKLDECTGTTAYNSATNAQGEAAGMNGTLTIGASGTNTSAGSCGGTATDAWKNGANGKSNSSLSFDGTNDYVSIADNSILDFGANQDFSVAVWVKSTQTAVVNNYPMIVSKEYDGSAPRTGFNLISHDSTDDSRWYFQIYIAGTSYLARGRSNIRDGNWHYLVGIRNGSNLIVYEDGQYVTTTSASSSSISNNVALRIAASGETTPSSWSYYQGQVDDVRIYNYGLTAKQVQLLYSQNAAALFAPVTGSP